MDATRFHRMTRIFTEGSSRRGFLRGIAATAIGLAAVRLPGSADAKKKRKKKLRKPQLNAYGCVDVGQACSGNDANCCSGLCEGKKPKKGKKDKSTCAGHDVGTCQAGDNGEICGALANVSCTTSAGDSGLCHTTTGNAGHCSSSGKCAVCQRDADCEEIVGAGAACLLCGGCAKGTICGGVGAM